MPFVKFNVNREVLFRGEFFGEVNVPDDVVAEGNAAIRAYIKDVSGDDMRDSLEIEEDKLVFELLEDE